MQFCSSANDTIRTAKVQVTYPAQIAKPTNMYESLRATVFETERVAAVLSVFLLVGLVVLSGKSRGVFLLGGVAVLAAVALTTTIFDPFLFIDIYTGGNGEAMLGTLPLTLVGAPGTCLLIWFLLMKLINFRIARRQ
jgi:hypothetical protein